MDKLVYWAGSASEGIIIPPPSGSIDAAHQSGVKVLGQIFFPPYAFGGNSAWVTEMLTQEGGKYIFAKKLYEIAKYLGSKVGLSTKKPLVDTLLSGLNSLKNSTNMQRPMAIITWKFNGITPVVILMQRY